MAERQVFSFPIDVKPLRSGDTITVSYREGLEIERVTFRRRGLLERLWAWLRSRDGR